MTIYEIEVKSQWLRHQLEKPISVRLKLLSILNFFSSFAGESNQARFISYYLQFKNDLLSLIKTNQLEYFTPSELDALSNLLKKLIEVIRSVDGTMSANLFGILDTARKRIIQILDDEADEDEATKGAQSFSLNQVLIEMDDETKLATGIVERLSVDVMKNELPETQDTISFGNRFEGMGAETHDALSRAVSLAVKGAARTVKRRSSYRFDFSFEKKDYVYSGISMGLSVAALTCNSILRLSLHKEYCKFRNDVVMASAVDEYGDLVPLDPPSLRIKLETVFFSPYKKMIIPEGNILEARLELEKLNGEYPKRRLELIPIRNYLSLFRNLDVVEVCRLSRREKLRAHYGRYHTIVNSALSLFLLAALSVLALRVVIPNLDHNPIYTGIKDDRFVAYNKYGKAAWESELLNQGEIADAYLSERIAIADINDDKQNDIIYLRRDNSNPTLSKTVFCRGADNALRWKTEISPIDSVYGKDFCYDGTDLRSVRVTQSETTGKIEIIVAYMVCELYPFFVTVLDGKGKEVSTFYNPGHMGFTALMDVDNDGHVEYLIAGENNDYGHCGYLAVFDPDFISGLAPCNRFPRGLGMGLMKYYALFPKGYLNRFSNVQSSYVNHVKKTIGKVDVDLRETVRTDENDPTEKPCGLVYTFDSQFNLLHVETSTEFDNCYRELLGQGKIRPIEDWKAYENMLRSQMKWWDGDKFVNHPVINKCYLLAKAATQQGIKNRADSSSLK